MLRKIAVLGVLFLTFLSFAEAQKKRVAVMNFDYAAVSTSVPDFRRIRSRQGHRRPAGGQAGLDGVYSVIERKQLDKIIAEQNFSNSDRADPASAAKIARILGVDAIIIGSITQFGRDDKKTNVGGGALGGVTGRFGIGGVSKSKSTAVVQITGRMIDTSTAEILASSSARANRRDPARACLGAGGGSAGIRAARAST